MSVADESYGYEPGQSPADPGDIEARTVRQSPQGHARPAGDHDPSLTTPWTHPEPPRSGGPSPRPRGGTHARLRPVPETPPPGAWGPVVPPSGTAARMPIVDGVHASPPGTGHLGSTPPPQPGTQTGMRPVPRPGSDVWARPASEPTPAPSGTASRIHPVHLPDRSRPLSGTPGTGIHPIPTPDAYPMAHTGSRPRPVSTSGSYPGPEAGQRVHPVPDRSAAVTADTNSRISPVPGSVAVRSQQVERDAPPSIERDAARVSRGISVREQLTDAVVNPVGPLIDLFDRQRNTDVPSVGTAAIGVPVSPDDRPITDDQSLSGGAARVVPPESALEITVTLPPIQGDQPPGNRVSVSPPQPDQAPISTHQPIQQPDHPVPGSASQPAPSAAAYFASLRQGDPASPIASANTGLIPPAPSGPSGEQRSYPVHPPLSGPAPSPGSVPRPVPASMSPVGPIPTTSPWSTPGPQPVGQSSVHPSPGGPATGVPNSRVWTPPPPAAPHSNPAPMWTPGHGVVAPPPTAQPRPPEAAPPHGVSGGWSDIPAGTYGPDSGYSEEPLAYHQESVDGYRGGFSPAGTHGTGAVREAEPDESANPATGTFEARPTGRHRPSFLIVEESDSELIGDLPSTAPPVIGG